MSQEAKDFSHEIFDKYFESGHVLSITLKDKSVLVGMLVGFFHGEDETEAYIVKWNFIKEGQIKESGKSIIANETGSDKLTIMQKDIEKVEFK